MDRFNQIDRYLEILLQAKELDTDIIERLIQSLQEMVKEKKKEQEEEVNKKKEEETNKKKEFTFKFDVTFCPSERQVYAGKAFVSPDGFLRPQIFKTLKTRIARNKKDKLRTKGEYKACAGDIIVKRLGGDWKTDLEYWYLVTEDGKEVQVASYRNQEEQQKVIDYLKGEITARELL